MEDKSYIIKYEVHCKFQNFFNKEIIVKKCISEIHAKTKLDEFCKKKYSEYQYIIIKSCSEKNIFSEFEDIFKGNNIFSGFEDTFGKKEAKQKINKDTNNKGNILGGK